MGNFFAELKQRHIYHIAGAYAVVAWLLLQLVNNVAPVLDLPAWIARACLLLLALGFPIAIFFAWMRELPASAGAPREKATMADWALVGVLVAVLVALVYQEVEPRQGTLTAQTGLAAAQQAAAKPAGISVAVLPFVNLSSDKEQEFFSDGMTEEITTALAKIPDLRVVARESAFQFKGEKLDMRAVGQELGATHLIEGSVRKAGSRVRITAQLIKADDGTHLWADDYDRELTDIFVIQEDIARAITASLRMPLGLKPGENLINNRDIDPESYQQFLRARALSQGRGLRALMEAAALLEQIVGRHPNYAPAWALLGGDYSVLPNSTPQRSGSAEEFRRVVDGYFSKSDAALQRAIELDPTMPDPYGTLASRSRTHGKPLEAEASLARAIALDPAMAITHGHALILELVGHVKDALAIRQQLLTIEPFVPLYKSTLVGALLANGRNEEAMALASTLPPADNPANAAYVAMMYAAMGRYSEAADALTVLPSDPQVDAAMRLLHTAPAKTDMPQKLPALGVNFAWVYLYVGGESRVLDNYESTLDGGRMPGQQMGWLWQSSYAPVRKTERFKRFARKAGLVEYWRAKGWPEQCHPTTADDFECE